MKKNNYVNLAFLFIYLFIIYGGFLKPIIWQMDISGIENRKANLLPEFSLKSFFDKKIQDEYELAYADQIPFSETMKLYSKNISFATKIRFISTFDNSVYKKIGNYNLVDDYLTYSFKPLNNVIGKMDIAINSLNKIQRENKNIEFYVYYIESERDIDFSNNNKSNSYEHLTTKLNKGIKTSVFRINNLDDYKKYYYKTDHHWNYEGSYKGYKEIIRMIFGDKEKIKEPNSKLSFTSIFDGSLARELGGVLYFKETFNAYDFSFDNYDAYINNKKVDKIVDTDELKNNNPKYIRYGDWYGNDYGLLEYDFKNPKKQNLLIIGDSFDNAINELIASHFNKTYNVDLRHYEEYLGIQFSISKFIKDNKIDKVLFVWLCQAPYEKDLAKGID